MKNEMTNKGKSWKSKLQFEFDRTIKNAKDWDDFLNQMTELDYEIKNGKYIAFKHKDKLRFKTLGEDYTEDRLKERLTGIIKLTTQKLRKELVRVSILKIMKRLNLVRAMIFELRNTSLKQQLILLSLFVI
ncbi:hypothetical protein ACQV2S_00925 [Facklamia sp. P13064]|uniref:hypothetical protein n=1 Tax=Facklamia sp. P13064 TaxID=3421953 RepID=UPI003D16D7ED